MRRRRAQLLSMALAAGMMVSSAAPHATVLAVGKEAPVSGEIFSEDSKIQENGSTEELAEGQDFNGLEAKYYTTTGRGTGVVFDQLKSKSVDFNINYSDMDAKLKQATGQDNEAGVSWTGRIKVPETGNYTFHGYADNGIRVWVDGKQIINYWDGNSWDVPQTSAPVSLEAGKYYTFQTDYFEFEGGSHVILSWSNDQNITAKKAIPASAYYLPSDYDGIYISDYDTSNANLIEGEQFDGHISVTGTGFTEDTTFEVVKATGISLGTPLMAEIQSLTAEKAELVIPNLTVGTYKIKASLGDTGVVSKDMLIVEPSSSAGQTRSETPRPGWERNDFMNLNGWWDFSFDPEEVGLKEGWFAEDRKLERLINVPFCWESSLSGIEDPNYLGQAWYQRKVMVDENWDGRKLFLKFGAVDWKCKLWINGEEVGEHIGGYNAFEFDVTDHLKMGEENTITLWVEDKGSYGDNSYPALIGKQGRNAPCGYIHTSGIWQTVGLEARSATYLDNAKAAADIDASTVTYTVDITSDTEQELTISYDFESKRYDAEKEEDIPTGSAVNGEQAIRVAAGKNTLNLNAISVEQAKLWNYNDPNLYYGTITVKDSKGNVLDTVDTYFGMRKVEQKYFDESLGVKYIYINNEPVYMSGLLDQGFWEDGIYTAPSEEALKYDILKMKETGFNMIRKHLKVEDPLQYYWCDKLGMLVWQDMPHATAMVPSEEGGEAPGRQYFEECLDSMMNMNYNHPSIVAVMLFNETWGLEDAYFHGKRDVTAADGKSTKDWVEELFHRTKALNPNMLVEDMSACNGDHVQPTELNTYHMYPNTYQDTVNTVERWTGSAFVGSTDNFKFGEVQDGDPLLNSEYGGVGAGSGDFDVSYCFKYMTDIQRRYEKQSGFVYTEPFDIEYERNGFMTYDRKMKVFGYDEIAYGGDMAAKDLIQEIYIGAVDQPIRNVKPGQKMKTKVMAMGWTNDLPEDTVMKWRFDGTDIYGNRISTGESGTQAMRLSPYRKATATINYQAPKQACVGTLTMWLEDGQGKKLAKNFTNVVVKDATADNEAYIQEHEDGSVVMKAKVDDKKMVSIGGAGAQSYRYTLPEGLKPEDLNGMRVIAEASSYKAQIGSDKFLSSFSSAWGQTAEGRERASDLTVSVNGVEIDTVYLPDNPRDMRGTLTLNNPYNGETSAGDFGYLVNLNITKDKLEAIKASMNGEDGLTVTYEVKEGAENENGLRIYNSIYGRYAVNPTIVLNPTDETVEGIIDADRVMKTESDNYSVEASLENQESYVVRNENGGGYEVIIGDDARSVALINVKTGETIASSVLDEGETEYDVKTTLFDEQIRIYVDHDPEPVINVYDKSGFTGDVTIRPGAEDVVVAPESYEAVKSDTNDSQKDVDITDDFTDENLDNRYEKMGKDLGTEVKDGVLNMTARSGDKLIMKDVHMSDGIYEADVSVNELLVDTNGNIGFTFRSGNYQLGADGLDGYYAGVGNGYIQLGRMKNNWTELANVKVPELQMGTTHKLKVAVFGSRIQVYLDDVEKPYIDITDTMYTEGGAAIRGYNSKSTIDNIKVMSVPNYTSDFEHNAKEWDASGEWKAADGVYTASSKKAFSLIDSTEQKDLILSADLKAGREASTPSIVLRAKNGSNGLEGYRAVLNTDENTIQLIKMEQGTETVLGERAWKLDVDRVYHVSAEAKGGSLKVYLNHSDQALITVNDQTFKEGKVGLYSESGISVFDNVAANGNFIDGEELPPANTAALEKLEADAKKLDESQYTSASYAKVTEALKALKTINIYDQTEIDQAAETLKDALDHLVLKEPAGPTEEELAEAVKKAEAAQKAAEEAKQQAEEAKAAAERLAEEAKAAKEAAQEAQKKAEEMENASREEKEAAQAAAKAAAEKAKEAEEKALAAEAAVKEAKEAQMAAEEALNKSLVAAEKLRDELKAAKDEAEKAKAEANKAKEEAEQARKEAEAAAKRAEEALKALQDELNAVQNGQIFTAGGLQYKVTSVTGKTASIIGVENKKLTKATIPATVQFKDAAYKVTAIAKNAFKGNKKLTKVTLGTNVTNIGRAAFYKANKLKSVVIKSVKLKSIGKNSFKGIAKKAYINVPNKKAEAYRNLFKKAGQPKGTKIK